MKTDLKYLTEICNGDKVTMVEMIDLFIVQINEIIDEMKKAGRETDHETLSQLAHKAKSSVAIMGMQVLSEKLKEFELVAKNKNNPEKYQGYIDFFIQESNIAVKELTEYKTTLLQSLAT